MTEDKNKYILSINGMSKSFGRNKVLKHISMNVKPGTIMGLMGENGAGKSTMMKCLFGTYQKDEGTIVLDGKEVNFSGPKDALENGVAMVHQELNQCLERSVVDNKRIMSVGRGANTLLQNESTVSMETSETTKKAARPTPHTRGKTRGTNLFCWCYIRATPHNSRLAA